MRDLQKGCIPLLSVNGLIGKMKASEEWISLDHLRHQLFINPNITGSELLEQLEDNKALCLWEFD